MWLLEEHARHHEPSNGPTCTAHALSDRCDELGVTHPVVHCPSVTMTIRNGRVLQWETQDETLNGSSVKSLPKPRVSWTIDGLSTASIVFIVPWDISLQRVRGTTPCANRDGDSEASKGDHNGGRSCEGDNCDRTLQREHLPPSCSQRCFKNTTTVDNDEQEGWEEYSQQRSLRAELPRQWISTWGCGRVISY